MARLKRNSSGRLVMSDQHRLVRECNPGDDPTPAPCNCPAVAFSYVVTVPAFTEIYFMTDSGVDFWARLDTETVVIVEESGVSDCLWFNLDDLIPIEWAEVSPGGSPDPGDWYNEPQEVFLGLSGGLPPCFWHIDLVLAGESSGPVSNQKATGQTPVGAYVATSPPTYGIEIEVA